MSRVVILGSALFLAGCEQIEDVADYFSNVVAEGLILGVDDPDVAALVGGTAAATAFLARATSLSDVASNVFADADQVQVVSPGGTFDLANRGDGLYLVTSVDEPGLDYAASSTWTLRVTEGSKTYTAEGVAPAAPVLGGVPAPPATHPANQALNVTLGGQTYDNVLVVVADDAGNVTYDSRPADVSGYIDWIGGGGDVTSVSIPGSAFPSSGTAYIVGVAGVLKAPDSGFEEFNPLVSNLAIGAMGTAPLVTAP